MPGRVDSSKDFLLLEILIKETLSIFKSGWWISLWQLEHNIMHLSNSFLRVSILAFANFLELIWNSFSSGFLWWNSNAAIFLL